MIFIAKLQYKDLLNYNNIINIKMITRRFVSPDLAIIVGKIYKCDVTKYFLDSGIRTVNRLDEWNHIKKFGLKLTNSTNVDEYILREIDNDSKGHSGGTMVFTCNHLNKIAECGFDEKKYIMFVLNDVIRRCK